MNNAIFLAPYKQSHFMKVLKLITLTATALASGFLSNIAFATCNLTSGSTNFSIQNASIPALDSRTPINGVLTTFNVTANGQGASITCSPVNLEGSLDSDFNYLGEQLYATGLLGISMRINMYGMVLPAKFPPSSSGVWNLAANQQIKIELIKTGDTIEAGYIDPKVLLRGVDNLHQDFVLGEFNMLAPWEITMLRPTCEVSTRNFTVNLGSVNIADFNASGRTQPTNFSIDLSCTGGTDTTDVHVTLTDANNPTNTTTQLNLSPDSGALGIALEVNNRNGAVTFGPDLSGTGNPGQWRDGAAGAGSYSIPLSVNYVRLPGPIKGGSANSGVTYTLNYD